MSFRESRAAADHPRQLTVEGEPRDGPEDQHLPRWNADRWNLAKLVVGVACTMCMFQAVLAAMVALGLGSVPHAHPGLNAAPVEHSLWFGAATVALALAFHALERRRRAVVNP